MTIFRGKFLSIAETYKRYNKSFKFYTGSDNNSNVGTEAKN